MNAPPRPLVVAVFCLSCGAAQRSPESPPSCFTGTGAIEIPSPAPPPPASREGTIGLGNLGKIGGNKVVKGAVTVLPGQALYQGAIERGELGRTVRSHLQELATCSKSGEEPVSGRIVVDFVIDAQGRVERSSIRDNTTDDRDVESCVGEQACRWTFTAPRDGGKALVSYPLHFFPYKLD
jgi:TonB family protein